MITVMPMALQKPVEAYFEKSLSKQSPARHLFSSGSRSVLGDGIQRATEKEPCLLVRYREGDKDLYGMCCSKSTKDIIEKTIDELEVVTFFFGDGAVALSADESVDNSRTDLHLVSWGSAVTEIDALAEKCGGQRY